MPILSEAERSEKIINYISLHQGCSKEEVCDALVDMLSRNTFFKDLPNLIKEGKIIVNHKNKRDTSLSVDKKNPLIYMPKNLEDFERAYTRLLDVSIKRIKEKDFSELVKLLGIEETDPAKWSANESIKYLAYENKMSEEYGKGIDKTVKVITKGIEKYSEKIKQIDKDLAEYTKRTNDIRRVPIEDDKKIWDHTLAILKTIDFPKVDEKLEFQRIHNLEVSMLIWGCIRIYLVILDIITNLSISVWPNIIRNRENLKKLYAEVYSKIAEIQFQLSSSLVSMTTFFIHKPPNEFFMRAKFMLTDGSNSLIGITQIYRALNMQTEIESIIDLINKIKADLLESGYNGGIDLYEETLHRNNEIINKVKELERGISEIQIRNNRLNELRNETNLSNNS